MERTYDVVASKELSVISGTTPWPGHGPAERVVADLKHLCASCQIYSSCVV